MTNTHPTSTHHAPEQMAEPDHVDIGSIVRYAVGLTAVTAISMLGMYFTYNGLGAATDAANAVQTYPMAQDADLRQPPEPRLQGSNATVTGKLEETPSHTNPTPREALQELRAEEDAVLNGYGWVDRNAGIVRVPIAEAMRLQLQKGLESRAAVPAAAAPVSAEPAKEQAK